MPHVHVYYNGGQNPNGKDFPWKYAKQDEVLNKVRELLRHLCAEHLSCEEEGGKSIASDFSVFFHPLGPYDVISHHLEIKINTYDFPSRQANIDERCEKIRDALREQLQSVVDKDFMRSNHLTFYVWARLSPAGIATGEVVSRQRTHKAD